MNLASSSEELDRTDTKSTVSPVGVAPATQPAGTLEPAGSLGPEMYTSTPTILPSHDTGRIFSRGSHTETMSGAGMTVGASPPTVHAKIPSRSRDIVKTRSRFD